ncbi:AAA domain-containing protein [Mycoplasma struthionis]|uniref:DUF4011 domain-containing protein n=1 Tax=Mycoplasma struthionis TaxID=538220 RepID=A0A3G8LGV3_9MOLU|nr:DEAD/DEAH box helicase [Mycoplasma struthionis]AZG68909.1 DUF4011 domain-containing protein [Mycoplasma struthionis]
MEKYDVKYQKIMANLLDIEQRDSSLFSNINNEKYFDVLQKFGEKTFEQIYYKNDFNLPLIESDNISLREKVAEAKNKTEIVSIFKEYSQRVDDKIFKTLSSDFEKGKAKIISQLETEFQKSFIGWKKLLKQAQDVNIETNIWPLHIGLFFISIKTEKKAIYAPLFFKEVTLEIKNSIVYLISTSDIKINSKLITFLEQEGFMLNLNNVDFANLTFEALFNLIHKEWTSIYEIPNSLKSKILDLNESNITNEAIKFHPGMVLGFYNVSSGYLWNQMLKIIKQDEFKEILNPEIIKKVYSEKIKNVIFDKNFKLFKIQETNFSQDMATVSALYQDTIIWGPPGTGKSQTISNLILNIIARNKTALVVSEKKAALEVLTSRLKEIRIFCLFVLNDRDMRLDSFYEPLEKFIKLVEHYRASGKQNALSVFAEEDKRYLEKISELKNNKNLENVLNFYASVYNGEIDEASFENVKQLDPSINYAISSNFKTEQDIKKALYELNKNKKPGFFTIYPKNIKESAQIIFQNQNLLKYDLNNAIKFINSVELQEIIQIDKDFKEILDAKSQNINNGKILTNMILELVCQKIEAFDEKQREQYNAFAMSIRTGHLKPFKFFHKHKDMIKILFPVIVTTPEFDLSMWEKQEFDFAILDESSQIFLEKGIPILYLAKRKVMAGDDQQMQPTKWFATSYDFDEDENDFGNIESLLDYAKAVGVYSILLDKNYRSKQAALMTFSSKHFYESKLDVIDDYECTIKKDPAIEVLQVNGVWDNSKNEVEANEIIRLAKESLKKYKKIILLVFNIKQQEHLLNLIYGSEPELEQALNENIISVKNIENIQGDEADIVIMSVSYDKNTTLYNTYVARKGGKNALNVAISRAREKIIVVKSIFADDVEINERSTKDMIIFKKWLRFLDLNKEEQKII